MSLVQGKESAEQNMPAFDNTYIRPFFHCLEAVKESAELKKISSFAFRIIIYCINMTSLTPNELGVPSCHLVSKTRLLTLLKGRETCK